MDNVRNARYNIHGTIDCEINHPEFGWIPTTLSADDEEPQPRKLLSDLLASGDPIAPYDGPTIQEVELARWRQGARVSAFQAMAALDHFGLLDQVEAMMDDPETPRVTKLAWQKAQEFRYNSPMVDRFCDLLGIDQEMRDQLFKHAETIEA